MYSPGALKVAVVVPFPTKAEDGGALVSVFSTCGFSLANVTVPGPRHLLHVSVTGAPRMPRPAAAAAAAAKAPFMSSASQAFRFSGVPTVAVISLLIFCGGPCTHEPPSSKLMNGGVLPLASVYGETSHSVFRLSGITVVFLLATMVQVSFFSPK